MSDHQRDRAIERMLRRGVAAPPPSALPNTCVDAETLAAWSSGALDPNVAARVEDHLADCARCQALLAAFARTEPFVAAPAPWWRRSQAPWLVPLATAATVAAILVAIPHRDRTAGPDTTQTMASASRESAESQPPTGAMPGVGAEPAPSTIPPAPIRREGRVGVQEKAQSAATAAESDAHNKAEHRGADRLAGEAPSTTPAAAPSAPPPAAVSAESAARDQAAAAPMLRAASPMISFSAPGSAIHWRIVAGQVQRSMAQSENWEPVPLPAGMFVAGHAPSTSVIWLVGRAGTIFVSNDAGANFVRVPFISTADLASIVAVDDREAIVTTLEGRRFRTADGGATWSEVF